MMPDTWTPAVVVDSRIEVVLNLVGVGAGVAAAYHAGQTGNWVPLMAISMLLVLVIIFVNSA
jgi:hypothetical protein